MDTFDDYIERTRSHSEYLKQYSSDPGLLRRPFANDNVVSFALRLQTQVTSADPGDRMELAKVAAVRLQNHYDDLFHKQRLFVASQQLFALDKSRATADHFQLLETQEFNSATVTGSLLPFEVITTEIPQLCMKIGNACIKYIEHDDFENEFTPNCAVSIPVTRIETYAFM